MKVWLLVSSFDQDSDYEVRGLISDVESVRLAREGARMALDAFHVQGLEAGIEEREIVP